jgi:hypothetical protein
LIGEDKKTAIALCSIGEDKKPQSHIVRLVRIKKTAAAHCSISGDKKTAATHCSIGEDKKRSQPHIVRSVRIKNIAGLFFYDTVTVLLQVNCITKSSALRDDEKIFKPEKDSYYDMDAEQKELGKQPFVIHYK